MEKQVAENISVDLEGIDIALEVLIDNIGNSGVELSLSSQKLVDSIGKRVERIRENVEKSICKSI